LAQHLPLPTVPRDRRHPVLEGELGPGAACGLDHHVGREAADVVEAVDRRDVHSLALQFVDDLIADAVGTRGSYQSRLRAEPRGRHDGRRHGTTALYVDVGDACGPILGRVVLHHAEVVLTDVPYPDQLGQGALLTANLSGFSVVRLSGRVKGL